MMVNAQYPGRVVLHVATMAYGVARQDSLAFVVGWPLAYFATVNTRYQTGAREAIKDFSPDTIKVGVGANVLWANISDTNKVDIQFDDPTAAGPLTGFAALFGGPGSGNIPPFAKNDTLGILPGYAGRSFAHAGRYSYHSTRFGVGGVIVVCAESDRTCFPF
jgi:hypothetical protein